MQREVTLAGNRHAEGAMTEHLDADRLAAWSADVFSNRLFVDFFHLLHAQFACQYHYVSKLCVKP